VRDHVFGMCQLKNWLARDLLFCEATPLGA